MALEIAAEQPEGAIYLIPARLDDCQISTQFNKWHWVNMFDENGYERLFQSLNRRAEQLNLEINKPIKSRTQSIPVLGSIAAGLPIQFPSLGEMYLGEDIEAINVALSFLHQGDKVTDLFALKVQGESLIDAMVNDGDFVIMKRTEQASDGEMVAIWLPSRDETTLKYFYKEKERYRLQPANPTMGPIYVNKNEPLEIKGKVMLVIRGVDSTNAVK